jgi:hypothetical protein
MYTYISTWIFPIIANCTWKWLHALRMLIYHRNGSAPVCCIDLTKAIHLTAYSRLPNGLVSMFASFSLTSACKGYVPTFCKNLFVVELIKLNHISVYNHVVHEMQVNTKHENGAWLGEVYCIHVHILHILVIKCITLYRYPALPINKINDQ